MNIKVIRITVTIFVLLFVFSGLAAAQETEQDTPGFVREVLRELEERGWTEERLEELRTAAEERTWEEAEGSEPEVVAMALELANQDREKLEGAENADLALELARMAGTMERSGFEDREIARATFDGTRDVVQNMNRIRTEARVNAADDAVDVERIRERVRSEIRERLREAMKIRERAVGKASSPKGAGKGPGKPADTRGPREQESGRPGFDPLP